MAAFPNMEADNVHLTAGEAKVETGETGLGTGIDQTGTDFLLVAQIGVGGKCGPPIFKVLMRLFDCNWNLFSEDLDGFSVCAWMGL
jgi:hypothetical protein